VPAKTDSRLRRLLRPDVMVAAGILASRLSGLVRTIFISYYFGIRAQEADAFWAAFRIPNLLQNLFGQGALSASFIPVHTALHAQGRERDASQMARTVFALLMVVVSVLVLAGVLATPLLVDAVAAGFHGEKRALTIRLVRILFPGAGLLVAAAWCLGVLNSHGKFLLSYASGVAWNGAMIATLLLFGGSSLDRLVVYLAWGSVVGNLLQFSVQAPAAFALTRGGDQIGLTEPVRRAIRDFLPVLVSRGAVQFSSYIDGLIASFLPLGAVAALANAQLIYTLPVNLFGGSVAAAELPALSIDAAREMTAVLRGRIDAALARLTFFVVPSAIAFAALGDMIASVLLQHGRFSHADSLLVWGILVGAAVGLLAATQARLYSVAHYALKDTRTPLRCALIRLTMVSVLGYYCAIVLPGRLGIAGIWGAAGLTSSAGVAGWLEFALLRRSMRRKIGPTGVPTSLVARLWASGLLAAAAAWTVRVLLPIHQPALRGLITLGIYGASYVALTIALHVPGVRNLIASLRRKPVS
jgi:putative peptidoglycan lipid II flippase